MTRFKPLRIEHQIEVTARDETTYTGVYWTEGDNLYVRAANGKSSGAVRIGWTDEDCLAKVILLELYGHPRITWGEWRPAGCEDFN